MIPMVKLVGLVFNCTTISFVLAILAQPRLFANCIPKVAMRPTYGPSFSATLLVVLEP